MIGCWRIDFRAIEKNISCGILEEWSLKAAPGVSVPKSASQPSQNQHWAIHQEAFLSVGGGGRKISPLGRNINLSDHARAIGREEEVVALRRPGKKLAANNYTQHST